MKTVFTRPLLLAIALAGAVISAPAFAMGDLPIYKPGRPGPGTPVASAPEIDTGSGLAALAAVFGALAFAWERRRSA